MPAAAAGPSDGLVLVICSPEGVSTLLVDAQGRPLESDAQGEGGADGDRPLHCTYAGPLANQLASPPSGVGPAGLILSAEIPRRQPERLPPTLPPGPLGSRAPPLRA